MLSFLCTEQTSTKNINMQENISTNRPTSKTTTTIITTTTSKLRELTDTTTEGKSTDNHFSSKAIANFKNIIHKEAKKIWKNETDGHFELVEEENITEKLNEKNLVTSTIENDIQETGRVTSNSVTISSAAVDIPQPTKESKRAHKMEKITVKPLETRQRIETVNLETSTEIPGKNKIPIDTQMYEYTICYYIYFDAIILLYCRSSCYRA